MSIETALQTLKKIKEKDFVLIKFTKKDGTERTMKCTLKFDQIPTGNRPKKTEIDKILNDIKKGNLRVYDLENKGWRTIPFDKILFIELENK